MGCCLIDFDGTAVKPTAVELFFTFWIVVIDRKLQERRDCGIDRLVVLPMIPFERLGDEGPGDGRNCNIQFLECYPQIIDP